MLDLPPAAVVLGVVFCAAPAVVVVKCPVEVVGVGRVAADVEGDVEGIWKEEGLGLLLGFLNLLVDILQCGYSVSNAIKNNQ